MQHVPLHSLSDYRKAIDSLDQSTNVIEVQAQAIARVQSTISSRIAKIQDVAESPSNLKQQQIFTLIEKLRREIQDENKVSSEKLRKQLSSSVITIADSLRRDDHILGQLESRISPSGDSHELDDERQEALLDTLRYTLSEAIKTRLNRIYLETSNAAHPNDFVNGHQDTNASYHVQRDSTRQTEDIRADLRSLHAEIDDVAQMQVTHEHGDSLSATLEQLQDSQRHLSNLRTRQVLRQLKSMTDQLEQIAAHCEALQSQRIAQQRLEAHYENIAKTHQPRHQFSTVPSRGGIGMDEGPAIAALRQYLNLDRDGNASSQREDQAKQEFEEYTAHIQASLELRDQQTGFLNRSRKAGGGERGGENYMSDGTTCEAKLVELDTFIAKVSAQMETLAG